MSTLQPTLSPTPVLCSLAVVVSVIAAGNVSVLMMTVVLHTAIVGGAAAGPRAPGELYGGYGSEHGKLPAPEYSRCPRRAR